MILSIIAPVLFNCLPPVIKNETPIWDFKDQRTINYCILRCKVIYPDAPCLKLFIKRAPYTYAAVCGIATEPKLKGDYID